MKNMRENIEMWIIFIKNILNKEFRKKVKYIVEDGKFFWVEERFVFLDLKEVIE